MSDIAAVNLLLALIRATIVAAASVAAAWPLRGWVNTQLLNGRGYICALIAIPLFTPAILVGYVFGIVGIELIQFPRLRDWTYIGLLFLRFVPAAMLVFSLAPSPCGGPAQHCIRLSPVAWHRRFIRLAGATASVSGAALGIVFLLVFNEFEIASLMHVDTWTVALFDAHAGGLYLSESLRLALPAAGISAVVLAGAGGLLIRARRNGTCGGLDTHPRTSWVRTEIALGIVMIAILFITIKPLGRAFGDAGASLLAPGGTIGGDIAASFLGAATAAAAAWFAAVMLVPANGRPMGRVRICAAIALSLPGLMGALVTGLMVLAFFRVPGPALLYGTPMPLALGLALLVLPFAILVRLLERKGGTERHAAAIIPGPEGPHLGRMVRFRLYGPATLWALCFLFWLAYADMQISAILEPPGMTPVFVRLYNLMHYGRSNMLSAMMIVAMAAPLALFAAARVTLGLMTRIRHA